MKDKKAFTLVEVLIATLVLLLIVGAFLSTLMQSSYLITGRSLEEIALNAARRRLEEFAVDIDIVTSITGYDGTTYDVTGLKPPPGFTKPLKMGITSLQNNLYEVKATVNWVEPNGRNVARSYIAIMRKK